MSTKEGMGCGGGEEGGPACAGPFNASLCFRPRTAFLTILARPLNGIFAGNNCADIEVYDPGLRRATRWVGSAEFDIFFNAMNMAFLPVPPPSYTNPPDPTLVLPLRGVLVMSIRA
jgi:hypothetical protein